MYVLAQKTTCSVLNYPRNEFFISRSLSMMADSPVTPVAFLQREFTHRPSEMHIRLT